MKGTERRQEILNTLQNSSQPVSGTDLANKFTVSRQVIVQDIAVLRAADYDILSTNRGYLINSVPSVTRIFKVSHTDDEIRDELNTVVDCGGKIIDVFVNHKAYGELRAPLNISSRRNVESFINQIISGKSTPLKNITSGYHYHTVAAESENVLDIIEKMLRSKGYLIE